MLLDPLSLSTEENIKFQAQLLNAVEQAIIATDLQGRIIYWNRHAEKLYGLGAGEAIGHNIIEATMSEISKAQGAEISANLILGERWSGEILLRKQDGKDFPAYISESPVLDEKGQIIGVVSISRDITDQKQLQEANRLLAEAGALLIDAVDFEAPLTTLAHLAVPQLADWCAVHLLQTDGSIEQVALAPAELGNLQAAYDWLQHYLPNDDTDGLPAVLRSGEPKLVTNVSSDIKAVAAAIKSYMIVPIITRPHTLGAITFVAAESGRSFDKNALALAENLVSHISIYLDKARLYRESQRLNLELEQRVSERTVELSSAVAQLKQSEATIQTLFRISNKLNATLELDTILDVLAQEAIRIVNGESGFAGLRTPEGMTVRKYFQNGHVIPFEYTWPLGNGIPGWVLMHKIPYGTSDAAQDPLMGHDLSINAGIRSIICTPILDSVGEVLAYFDIRNKQNGEGFTIDDQDMLMALAPVASIAIQNALAYQRRLSSESEIKDSYERIRALAANIELAREEERTQIARELHDQLGQALTAMKFDLAWLSDRLEAQDAILSQKSKAITAQMDTMVKTVRRIATELRPGMLDDLGLAASIEWQALDFEKRTGIVCAVSVLAVDVPLARGPSIALFRIFQEALTNVMRHAKAQHIDVTLTITPEIVTLLVHDDGRGIQAHEIVGLHSLGLLGMRERAKHLGGSFDIHGEPNDGTILTVSIPARQIES